jgi:hypothetical protein
MGVRTAPLVLLGLAAASVLVGCKKKPPDAGPKVGWVQSEGWKGACFYPKDYAALGPGDRKMARQDALEQMLTQWRGSRGDGVQFDDILVENVETTLLGRPEAIEEASQKNAELCEQYMASGDTSGWSTYLNALPGRLTAGECNTPLIDTWFNYLNIGIGWQNKAPVCQGNVVQITASAIDYYRITDKGPWINSAGDESQPTVAKDGWPCKEEGCFAGMVIGRFVGESGIEQIFPVGNQTTFRAPEHGSIEIMINDTVYYDNKFKIESGLEHHTSITYEPG